MTKAVSENHLKKRLIAFGVIFVTAVLSFLIWRFEPTENSAYFPQCPLYRTTGLQCGGCGLTRATHAFLHGDLISAFRFNAFFPIFLIVGVWSFCVLIRWAWNGKTPNMKFLTMPRVVVFSFAFLAFTILRNLSLW